jgi:predicted DNA-binding WGR domain protein
MVNTWDRPGPAGKPGTKGFVSAETRAVERALYMTTKKRQGGYREVDQNDHYLETQAQADEVNFNELQQNYEVGKPLNPTTNKDLKAREDLCNDTKRSIFTIKQDGLCHHILITPDRDVKIYTRKIEPCTDKYPYIVEEVKQLKLPPKTILTCEFVVKKPDGRDDRKSIQSISKSLVARAVALQDSPLCRPEAVVLHAQFWGGKPLVRDLPVQSWMQHLQDFFEDGFHRYVYPLKVYFGNFELAKQYVTDKGLEGLVVYDKESIFGDKAFNLRGTTERTACFKWKPIYEADCIMVFNPDNQFSSRTPAGGEWGSGRIKHLPKGVALYQWGRKNPKGRTLHFLCNCGSGFTDSDREGILKKAEENDGIVGVGVIHYASRFFISQGDDSNAMLEPIFKGHHPDKTTKEAEEPLLD